MDIHFYATLRPITGGKTVTLDLPEGTTVRQMLEGVFASYPLLRIKLMTADNTLLPHVHVFVNGRDVGYLPDDLETVIQADDKLDIFPAVGGG